MTLVLFFSIVVTRHPKMEVYLRPVRTFDKRLYLMVMLGATGPIVTLGHQYDSQDI
jgi:hypothetical protein